MPLIKAKGLLNYLKVLTKVIREIIIISLLIRIIIIYKIIVGELEKNSII